MERIEVIQKIKDVAKFLSNIAVIG